MLNVLFGGFRAASELPWPKVGDGVGWGWGDGEVRVVEKWGGGGRRG